MIIWGWGRVTKKIIGGVFQRSCQYCNTTSIWQLCLVRTWFTLFFIPIIPYKWRYCVVCPSCGSYIQLTKEQFEKIKADLKSATSTAKTSDTINDNLKYKGKTEAQINYLKQVDEHNEDKASNS